MAIPIAVIRKNVDYETRRMLGQANRPLSGLDLLWVEFYRKYAGLIVDFYKDYVDVSLRKDDLSYTPKVRLPYSKVWMWIDDKKNLLIYIEHPENGPVFTIVNYDDMIDRNWDLALRLVRKGREKYKKVMSQVS